MKTKQMFATSFLLALILTCSCLFLGGCFDDNVNTYTLSDINVGETFVITLQEPYSDGGWRWEYKISSTSGIEFVSEEFISDHPDDPDWCGSGGESVFTFKAIKLGQYKIKFIYQRPWAAEKPIETNIYEVSINK